MECAAEDYTKEPKYNVVVRRYAEQCRELVKENPPVPPTIRADCNPPTQYTFCKPNIKLRYTKKGVEENATAPCGYCIKREDKGTFAPCNICAKRAPTRDEKLADGIECIARPLPKWFNKQKCTCQTESAVPEEDKFRVNYPPSRLTGNVELRSKSNCQPNLRCTGTPPSQQEFIPNYLEKPITEKFYSRYENLERNEQPKTALYETELQKRWDFYPREYYCVPRYSNQMYGWLKDSKLQHLEFCDAKKIFTPKVLQNLRSLENRRYEPSQMSYCFCAAAIKHNDHWKIV